MYAFAGQESFSEEMMEFTRAVKEQSLFRRMGYGQLLDNTRFLYELLSELKTTYNLKHYVEDFTEKLLRLNSMKDFEQSESPSDEELSEAAELRLLESRFISEFINFSRFKSTFSNKMQSVAISLFTKFKNSSDPDMDIILLDNDLVDELKQLPEVESLFQQFMSSQSRSDLIADIFFPGINKQQFTLRIDDLERCHKCTYIQNNSFVI